MPKNSKKSMLKRFVYSIISFFAEESELPFDVGSYVINQDNVNCKFANLKIVRFIDRNRKRLSKNRIFLTISLNDNGTIDEGRGLIQSFVNECLEKFFTSVSMEILGQIDEKSFVEFFCANNYHSLTDYLVIIFYISGDSSIELIVSTDSITSKLIEKDEEGEAEEYNSKLYSNLISFEKNLQ